MDRYIFNLASGAMMLLGGGMVIIPARVLMASRDHGDTRGLTAGEVWRTRLAGVFVAAGSAYSLYALVTRMPGAGSLTP